jgi:phage FluMu protein Com
MKVKIFCIECKVLLTEFRSQVKAKIRCPECEHINEIDTLLGMFLIQKHKNSWDILAEVGDGGWALVKNDL